MSLPYLKQLKSNLKIMLQARGGVHLWPGSFLAGGLIEGESIKHEGFLLEQALLVHSSAQTTQCYIGNIHSQQEVTYFSSLQKIAS